MGNRQGDNMIQTFLYYGFPKLVLGPERSDNYNAYLFTCEILNIQTKKQIYEMGNRQGDNMVQTFFSTVSQN